jgi:predicted nucleotidyltransferase
MKIENFGLRESDIESIADFLKKLDTIEKAILFGSRAKGNYKHGSDVDIAIIGDFDFKNLTRLSYLLNQESKMPYKFDIIDYANIQNQELKDHIDRVGVTIYHVNQVVS